MAATESSTRAMAALDDLYRRHVRPAAAEREYILVARVAMLVMMILSSALAIGITEHPLFQPGTGDFQEREDARRLVLHDGIGEDLRVLVQAHGVPLDGWSFQRKLY